jgi:hypothetical protein
MDNPLSDATTPANQELSPSQAQESLAAEITKLRTDFQSRLIAANLRTEAVRAGMIDLDGLKLLDLAEVQLGPDDSIVGSRQLMDDLRRHKPWLFGATSSSSGAVAPVSQPVRQKSALEMTDEEYAAARAALTKRRY